MTGWKKPVAIGLAALVCGAAAISAERESTGITIQNKRGEAVTMHFAYALKNYQWDLASHPVAAGQEFVYPFPPTPPACEMMRDWHIADGVVSITDSQGMFCELRLSLCDAGDRVAVHEDRCYWITPKELTE
ncbi:MAG: hypothetical protein K1X51_02065 [Rhodospirillaceae bacterium]|nr:hypothetical protein [Rhodospirillaceae bacterium]